MQEDLVILLEWLSANGINEFFNNKIENDNLIKALATQQNTLKQSNSLSFNKVNEIRSYADLFNNIEDILNFINTNNIYENFRKTSSNSIILSNEDFDNTDILIINDIPNDKDDLSGNIYSGDDGLLIKNMMSSIDVNNYLLLNMFFWRLPGNRNPIKEEFELCKPFVEKIISIIKPKVIILTGNYSTSLLVEENKNLLNIKGKILEYSNCYIENTIYLTGIYNPNFILKNIDKKKDIFNILLKIKSLL